MIPPQPLASRHPRRCTCLQTFLPLHPAPAAAQAAHTRCRALRPAGSPRLARQLSTTRTEPRFPGELPRRLQGREAAPRRGPGLPGPGASAAGGAPPAAERGDGRSGAAAGTEVCESSESCEVSEVCDPGGRVTTAPGVCLNRG